MPPSSDRDRSTPAARRGSAPRVVVVIGGSSGIGKSAALGFAALGDHVALASRSEAALVRVADECREHGAGSVQVRALDIVDADAVESFLAGVRAGLGRIDVLVQAATVMAYGTVEDVPAAVFDTVVSTAITGTANVARSILPIFRQQGEGVLIVVNSLLGSIAAPKMGAYGTAKWGQLGLLRVLQLETRDCPGIHVCSIVPGGVNTPIYYQAANYVGRQGRPPIPVDQPEKVARAIVECAARPRPRTSVGPLNPIIVAGFRLLPRVYDALVTPLLNVGALSRTKVEPTSGNVFAPVTEQEGEYGNWPRH